MLFTMVNKIFAIWLSEEIQKRGLTQKELAEKSNVHPSVINSIIMGTRNPSIGSCTAIAKGLNLPIETVLRYAGILPVKSDDDPLLDHLKTLAQLLDDDEKQILIDLAESLYERQVEKEKENEPSRYRRPPAALHPAIGAKKP